MIDTEGAIKIALAAKRWQDAVTVRQAARQAWLDAWANCFVMIGGQSLPLFELSTEMSDEYQQSAEWIYTEHAPESEDGPSLRFETCTADPLWIDQNAAWKAWKAQCRKVGHALATLTRMTRRWSAKQVAP